MKRSWASGADLGAGTVSGWQHTSVGRTTVAGSDVMALGLVPRVCGNAMRRRIEAERDKSMQWEGGRPFSHAPDDVGIHTRCTSASQ